MIAVTGSSRGRRRQRRAGTPGDAPPQPTRAAHRRLAAGAPTSAHAPAYRSAPRARRLHRATHRAGWSAGSASVMPPFRHRRCAPSGSSTTRGARDGLLKIMRGQPDLPFGQQQTRLQPHLAAEPRVGAAALRPTRLIQPTEQSPDRPLARATRMHPESQCSGAIRSGRRDDPVAQQSAKEIAVLHWPKRCHRARLRAGPRQCAVPLRARRLRATIRWLQHCRLGLRPVPRRAPDVSLLQAESGSSAALSTPSKLAETHAAQALSARPRHAPSAQAASAPPSGKAGPCRRKYSSRSRVKRR